MLVSLPNRFGTRLHMACYIIHMHALYTGTGTVYVAIHAVDEAPCVPCQISRLYEKGKELDIYVHACTHVLARIQ